MVIRFYSCKKYVIHVALPLKFFNSELGKVILKNDAFSLFISQMKFKRVNEINSSEHGHILTVCKNACYVKYFTVVQEKVDMLTEKVESTGTVNVDTSEKQGELGGSDGTIASTKTAVSKKTCKLISKFIIYLLYIETMT